MIWYDFNQQIFEGSTGALALTKPADDTNLVVCIVGAHGTPTMTGRPHQWSGTTGISTHRMWAWQGDGTIPSVDVTWTGGGGQIHLFSFAGFQTATPVILFEDASAQSSATSAPIPSVTTPAGSHAVVAFIGLQNGGATAIGSGDGWDFPDPASGWNRVGVGARLHDAETTTPGAWTWGTGRTYLRRILAWPATLPPAPPDPPEIASLSMLGDMPVVARYLGDTPVGGPDDRHPMQPLRRP